MNFTWAWIHLIAVAVVVLSMKAKAELIAYPAPPGEELSTNYTVEVDGKPVVVYLVRTQHENKLPYSFAYFDFSNSVKVKIKSSFSLNHVVVCSDKYGMIDHRHNGHPQAARISGRVFFWALTSALAGFFPALVSRFQLGYVFLFFCAMMVLQLIWVKTMVVETKGVPLEQVQKRLAIVSYNDEILSTESPNKLR